MTQTEPQLLLHAIDAQVVQALRSSGYLTEHDELTDEAFQRYFDEFEDLVCPPQVQNWADAFGINGVRWKRARDILKGQHRCFTFLNVIVISDGATLRTWYHELAHAAFPYVPANDLAELSNVVRRKYRVVRNDDPDIRRPDMPDGKYLELVGSNGQYDGCWYFGLDHSGLDGEDDELWAAVFALYCDGFEFPANVLQRLEAVIRGLESRNSTLPD